MQVLAEEKVEIRRMALIKVTMTSSYHFTFPFSPTVGPKKSQVYMHFQESNPCLSKV
jgi:hypothetical protein